MTRTSIGPFTIYRENHRILSAILMLGAVLFLDFAFNAYQEVMHKSLNGKIAILWQLSDEAAVFCLLGCGLTGWALWLLLSSKSLALDHERSTLRVLEGRPFSRSRSIEVPLRDVCVQFELVTKYGRTVQGKYLVRPPKTTEVILVSMKGSSAVRFPSRRLKYHRSLAEQLANDIGRPLSSFVHDENKPI